MKYREVAKILKESIDNNTRIEDVIMKKYEDLPMDEILRKLEDVNEVLLEVKDELGSVGPHKIYDYLMAPREEHKLTYEDENGNIKDFGTVEGSVKFDPNGEILNVDSINPNLGTISFGDKTYSTLDEPIPKTDLNFGDEEKKKDPWDLYDPTKYVESSEVTFGDKDDRRNKPSEDEPIIPPVYGDAPKNEEFQNILDEVGIKDEPTKFEYGDASVNGLDTSKKSNGATISPLSDIKFGDDDDNPPTNDNGFNGPSFGGF